MKAVFVVFTVLVIATIFTKVQAIDAETEAPAPELEDDHHNLEKRSVNFDFYHPMADETEAPPADAPACILLK